MTFEEFLIQVKNVQHDHPQWRDGQTYWNVLETNRPVLAELVHGTDVDPFYDDKRVSAFLTFVGERW